MLFSDLWKVTVLSDFRADPARCCVVGGILIMLQAGAEAWGGVSKAVQGVFSLE